MRSAIGLIIAVVLFLVGGALFFQFGATVQPDSGLALEEGGIDAEVGLSVEPVTEAPRVADRSARKASSDKGASIRGRVVDESGIGVVGVQVYLQGLDAGLGISADNGDFELPKRVQSGLARVAASSQSTSFIESNPQVVEIYPGCSEPYLTVRVRRKPSISGTVMTADGQPASGYGLTYTPRSGSVKPVAVAGADGRFSLFAASSDDAEADVRLVAARCAEYGMMRPSDPVAWGVQGVVLTVDLAPVIRVSVIDGNSAQPIKQFHVHMLHRTYSDLLPSARDGVDVHLKGSDEHVDLPCLHGELDLVVVPAAKEYAMSEVVTLSVESGKAVTPCVMKVSRCRELGLNVIDEVSGAPVASAKVSLVADVSDTGNKAAVKDARRPVVERNAGGDPILVVRHYGCVDQQLTDVFGTAKLSTRRSEERHSSVTLVVTHDDYLRQSRVVADWSVESVEVKLSKGRELVCNLSPPEILRCKPALRLQSAKDDSFGTGWSKLREGADSQVRLSGLMPGVYHVQVGLDLNYGLPLMVDEQSVVVDLRDGSKSVDLDCRKYLPGRLKGKVVGAGVWTLVKLHWVNGGEVGEPWLTSAVVGADGSFDFGAVPGGNLAVTAESIGGFPVLLGLARVEPGGSCNIGGDVNTRKIGCVLLCNEGGLPLEGTVVAEVSYSQDGVKVARRRAIADGMVEWSNGPNSPLTFKILSGPREGWKGCETSFAAKSVILTKPR